MVEKLPQTSATMVGETSLPPLLKADIALSLTLPDLAINLSIGWFLLVGVFFN
jgi:hypothetical protein